jgi:hypothetical protein
MERIGNRQLIRFHPERRLCPALSPCRIRERVLRPATSIQVDLVMTVSGDYLERRASHRFAQFQRGARRSFGR